MYILPLEPMTYKKQKRENEVLVKLRMIKLRKVKGVEVKEIAKVFQCSRNTVTNIVNGFDADIPADNQRLVLDKTNDLDTLEELLEPLRSKSTRPYTRHPGQATQAQEGRVVDLFNNHLGVGTKRMRKHLKRAYSRPGNNHCRVSQLDKSLSELTLAQIKGIYKRNTLEIKKKRSANGNVRHLYDYKSIAAFEYMHLDTKHILDLKALPQEIYDKFVDNKELPVYEWNLIDAKSRFRFIAYSRNLTAEFGLKFLLATVQYIRGVLSNHEIHMHLLTDNGTEFCSGSERKEKVWNGLLRFLNASIESYEPGFDVRKNLIERSHRTDDEEFFIPRGPYVHDKNTFLKEAREYSTYFNAVRPHDGIDMHDRTPLAVLNDCNVSGAKRLLNYPTMILEDHILDLSDITSMLTVAKYVSDYREQYGTDKLSQQALVELKLKVPYLKRHAQNVLTPYLLFTRRS